MQLTRAGLGIGCAFELSCAGALTEPTPAVAVEVRHGADLRVTVIGAAGVQVQQRMSRE